MAKRGYLAEYNTRKVFESVFGAVIKTAGGQLVPDFVCATKDKEDECFSVFAFEIKSSKLKKYYPKPSDIRQYFELVKWSQKTKIPVFYRIITKQNGKIKCELITIDEFKSRYTVEEKHEK